MRAGGGAPLGTPNSLRRATTATGSVAERMVPSIQQAQKDHLGKRPRRKQAVSSEAVSTPGKARVMISPSCAVDAVDAVATDAVRSQSGKERTVERRDWYEKSHAAW